MSRIEYSGVVSRSIQPFVPVSTPVESILRDRCATGVADCRIPTVKESRLAPIALPLSDRQ